VSPTPASATVLADSPADGDAVHAERCVSCGLPAGTAFCPRCGERRAADRRYSILHFAHEGAQAFTNADGSLLRTLRILLRRPGELAAA
jgi:hypothetical protein